MPGAHWNPDVMKPKPRCRLCRYLVKPADFVRLDGIYPAHRICAVARNRNFTEGADIHLGYEREPAEDEALGLTWWNALSTAERQHWSALAGNTGRAADAWEAFKQWQLDHTPVAAEQP